MKNDFFQKKVSTLHKSGTYTHVFLFVIPSYLICIMTSFRIVSTLHKSGTCIHVFLYVIPSYLICIMTSFRKEVSTLHKSGTCTHVFLCVIPSYLICIMTSSRKSVNSPQVRDVYTCFSFRHSLLFDMHNDFFQKKKC